MSGSAAPDGTVTAAAAVPSAMIRAVWTADCSATVEVVRLAGPRTGLWRLPGRLAHPPCDTSPCDLGQAEHKIALYQRCLTIGTQYDIYTWVNLPDLAQLWHLLELPPGLKAEWAGVLRSAGLLQNTAPGPDAGNGLREPLSPRHEPPREADRDRLLADPAAAATGDDQGPRRRAENVDIAHFLPAAAPASPPASVVVTSTQTIWTR